MQQYTCWIAAVLLLAISSVAQADLPQKEYEIAQLAEGVYGFVWKDPLKDPIEGNSLFIINENDVLVVDAGLFPTSTRLMIGELKKLTPKPVRYVVNTHFHDDHNNGNFVYREFWPGVEFIAHRDTRTDIIEQVNNVRDKDIQGMLDNKEKLEGWLKTGQDDDGKQLDEARKGRVRSFIDLFTQGVKEYRTVKNAEPELTFADSMTLHRGDRVIKLLWLGRGNTRGDAIVFLPKERIAATGDLIVYPVPFGFGSYYKEWATTLSRIDSLEADILFPGHGPPLRDRTYLHQVRGVLTTLVNDVEREVASGATLEETQERVTLSEWKETLSKKDASKERAFDQFFIAPAVERAWNQAKGNPESGN